MLAGIMQQWRSIACTWSSCGDPPEETGAWLQEHQFGNDGLIPPTDTDGEIWRTRICALLPKKPENVDDEVMIWTGKILVNNCPNVTCTHCALSEHLRSETETSTQKQNASEMEAQTLQSASLLAFFDTFFFSVRGLPACQMPDLNGVELIIDIDPREGPVMEKSVEC